MKTYCHCVTSTLSVSSICSAAGCHRSACHLNPLSNLISCCKSSLLITAAQNVNMPSAVSPFHSAVDVLLPSILFTAEDIILTQWNSADAKNCSSNVLDYQFTKIDMSLTRLHQSLALIVSSCTSSNLQLCQQFWTRILNKISIIN